MLACTSGTPARRALGGPAAGPVGPFIARPSLARGTLALGTLTRSLLAGACLALTALARRLRLRLESVDGEGRLTADGRDVTDELRTSEVERGVSLVARVSGVRRALVAQQRQIASDGPIVMAGRDIGTVVLPDTPVKVYLTASAEVRARRRHADMVAQGATSDQAHVLEELARRDKIDSERSDSPLRPAEDAILIDTDDLGIEQLTDRIVDLIQRD